MRESMLERLLLARDLGAEAQLRPTEHFYTLSGRTSRLRLMTDSPAPPANPADMRVLVVDDDDDLRELFVLILTAEGFTVAQAADGKAALEAVEKERPHLIVLDLMLPRYGGYEVLRKLQEGATASIPIFVVTGRYKDLATADMIRGESNVAAFLEKPVKQEELAAKAHVTLRTQRRP